MSNSEDPVRRIASNSAIINLGVPSPSIWSHYSFARDWYADALEEAAKEGAHARRREIVFAVCVIESYLVEWVRDEVLRGDFEALSNYFPADAYPVGIRERWKAVIAQLHEDKRIASIPDLGRPYWEDFRRLVDYRNGLVHGRSSRPETNDEMVALGDKEKPNPSWKDLAQGISARWATEVVAEVIRQLHAAVDSAPPDWLAGGDVS